MRHIVIDVGNLSRTSGTVFHPVVSDMVRHTGGEVDLYVMTHEHLDHVKGLLAAKNAGIDLRARYAWLTSSAECQYYEWHPDARQQLEASRLCLTDLARQRYTANDSWLAAMIENNSALLPDSALSLRTRTAIDHLRTIAPPDRTYYVDRESILDGKHPFTEARLRILAPEADTSVYYGRRSKAAPRLTEDTADHTDNLGSPLPVVPPVGVDAGAFFDLLESRQRLSKLAILAIDKAANNTSIVLEVEWRNWRLLFCGDAEIESWETMLDRSELRPVHFVKISHHGSINGTLDAALGVLLPEMAPDDRVRRAIVSTHTPDWDSVPDPTTLQKYLHRCTLQNTQDVGTGEAVEVRFPG